MQEVQHVRESGFDILPGVIAPEEADHLIQVLNCAGERDGIRRRGGVLAIRNLLEVVPEVADLARDARIRGLASSVIGGDPFAVRGILFDKTPDTNWKVTWHQDLTVAVRERIEATGFGTWSEKAGVPSVQPPCEILERMVTIRVHLDDCGLDNGPVRVLPGSHSHGRLSADQIEEWRESVEEVPTLVPKGGALLMRPLLLHASSPATNPRHRRVVHLDYAAESLPGGLEWFTSV
jgi:ectoine hydroxylase-related dioxygenase (phytanoyl-CoA dioxygenase family)